jgi:NitT/TauT family transport system permease protein
MRSYATTTPEKSTRPGTRGAPQSDAPPRDDRGRGRAVLTWSLRLVPIAVFLVVVTIGHSFNGLQGDLFPYPQTVLASLWRLIVDGTLLPSLGHTALECATAFGVSMGLAIVFGLVVGASSHLRDAVEPLAAAIYAVPMVILFPVFLTAFGLTTTTIVAFGVAHAFFPPFLAVLSSLRQVTPAHKQLCRLYRASFWKASTKVILPSISPHVFQGARISLSMSLLGVIIGEILSARVGLGYLVIHYYELTRFNDMYAAILATFIIIVVADVILRRAEALVTLRFRPDIAKSR